MSFCCFSFSLARIAVTSASDLGGVSASVETSGRVSETPLRPGAMGRTHLFVPLFRRCVERSVARLPPMARAAPIAACGHNTACAEDIATVCFTHATRPDRSSFGGGSTHAPLVHPLRWMLTRESPRILSDALPRFRECSFASASTAVDGTRDVPSLRGTVRWRMYSTSRAIRRACVCERVPGRRIPPNTEKTSPAETCLLSQCPAAVVHSTDATSVQETIKRSTLAILSGRNLIGRESRIVRAKSSKKVHPVHHRSDRRVGTGSHGPKTPDIQKKTRRLLRLDGSSLLLAVAPCRPEQRSAALRGRL